VGGGPGGGAKNSIKELLNTILNTLRSKLRIYITEKHIKKASRHTNNFRIKPNRVFYLPINQIFRKLFGKKLIKLFL